MGERFVYIHGVVGEGRSHVEDYDRLRRGLVGRGVRLPDVAGPESVAIEWGWDHPAAQDTAGLAAAQAKIRDLVAGAPRADRWSPRGAISNWIGRPVRDLLLFGPSDIAYYLSADGRRRVRAAIWSRLLQGMPDDEIDLTLIGHSAGSIIAHDFLFWLFSERREDRWAEICDTGLWERARQLWRLRRLVTMGSPLTPLLVRAPDLVDRIAGGRGPWLDPAVIGLDRESHGGVLPIWLNLWDEHDVAAFPIEGVYASDRVRDVYTDHSDWLPNAHGLYWRSRTVHQVLARHWND